MTEPLTVDPSRLQTAGAQLEGLNLPAPPPHFVAPGTDSVSAAINETLPIIESPVTDGLPKVEAALTRTGSSIVVAAGLYADTDQRLGEHVGSVQFLAGEAPSDDASDDSSTSGDQLLTADGDGGTEDGGTEDGGGDGNTDKGGTTPNPIAMPSMAQLGQMSQGVSQGAQTLMQGVQQVVQGVQGAAGSAGGGPAKLASDVKPDESSTEQTQLVDETTKGDEEEKTLAEGAAPGDQAAGGAPIEPTTGQPGTAPTEVVL